jgi:hypothetical protein
MTRMPNDWYGAAPLVTGYFTNRPGGGCAQCSRAAHPTIDRLSHNRMIRWAEPITMGVINNDGLFQPSAAVNGAAGGRD